MKTALFDTQIFYRAHLAKDARFDGKFFVAVKTTGIYCRPTCPAKKARLENLEFFLAAELAESAGYRPCLRCRPESAPGSLAWLGKSAMVQAAIKMIEAHASDNLCVQSLADKLGISTRWLSALFSTEVGITPQKLILNKKLNLARGLLEHSSQSITDIAFAAGFNSLRRFNDAFKLRFGKAPSKFRQTPKNKASDSQCLYLRYRPPLCWENLLDFFQKRMLPEIETVTQQYYLRVFSEGDLKGWFKLSLAKDYQIKVEFSFNQKICIVAFVNKIKAMLDLDACPLQVEYDLGQDLTLKPFLTQFSGIRVPGCFNNFELAVRTIIGQRISVKAAKTILQRLVQLCGKPQSIAEDLSLTHFFPEPEDILQADLSSIGLTKARVNTLKALATLITNETLNLSAAANYDETCKILHTIKGIGPWTVEYIAMRALKNPNAFPETDLEIQKKLKQYHFDPKKWVPWRAYGAILMYQIH